MINSIIKNEKAEITIKKSKFIANIYKVENENEAKNILNEISKKYFDAKHNCYAYKIAKIENDRITEIIRFSDNKEPQGTAGNQILEAIKNNNLCNVIIVVTRYFGGILLGTGGLSRAYYEASEKAIENAKIIKQEIGKEYIIECCYEEQKQILYDIKLLGGKITQKNYNQKVEMRVQISKDKEDELKQIKNIKITRTSENKFIDI